MGSTGKASRAMRPFLTGTGVAVILAGGAIAIRQCIENQQVQVSCQGDAQGMTCYRGSQIICSNDPLFLQDHPGLEPCPSGTVR
jgi:hypothetical protein